MSRLASLVLVMGVLIVGTPAWAAPESGQAAPALVVDELDGSRFDLALLRGHVVVINVWATWCEPCRAEMPILDDFYRRFHPQGLEFLGLSADATREERAVRTVMQPFLFPAALLKRAVQDGFGPPRIVPMTYVFDKQGILRDTLWAGGTPVTADNLEDVVKPLLTATTNDATR